MSVDSNRKVYPLKQFSRILWSETLMETPSTIIVGTWLGEKT